MYTILPSAFTETIPFWAVPNDDTERTSPSISVAIATGSIITDVSSSKLAAMFCAIGASFTALTVRFTVFVSNPPFPSAIV